MNEQRLIPRSDWAMKTDLEAWPRNKCRVCGRGSFESDHAACKASMDAYYEQISTPPAPEVVDAVLAAPEQVDHPAHYGGDTVYEVVKVCEAWGLDKDAYLFNVVKYVGRNGKKAGEPSLKDLKKARWYLNRRIDQLEGTEP